MAGSKSANESDVAKGRTPEELKDFYEKEYERGAGICSLPSDDDFMYGQILREVRYHLRPGKVALDLGCNNGNLSLYMAKAGCQVTGIDLAQSAVNVAIQSATHYRMSGARFFCLDFMREWNEPEVFDLIICLSVVEHIPDDQAFVRKIAWALRPGGTLIITGPSTQAFLYRAHMLVKGYYYFDEKVGHLHRYTEQGLVALCSGADLTVKRLARLDGILRDWCILGRPLRRTQFLLCRKYIRSLFNACDLFLAQHLPCGLVCVHADKKQ